VGVAREGMSGGGNRGGAGRGGGAARVGREEEFMPGARRRDAIGWGGCGGEEGIFNDA
jgi:hypothetical protein